MPQSVWHMLASGPESYISFPPPGQKNSPTPHLFTVYSTNVYP